MKQTRFFEDFEVGQQFRSRGRTVTDADIRMYSGATGADHPNHTDAEYCKQHPIFERPCIPGVLTIGVADGFVDKVITSTASLALSYGYDKVRFLRPVYPGDTVYADITITDKAPRDSDWGVLSIELEVKNHKDDLVTFIVYKLLVQRRAEVGGEQK